MRFSIGLRSPFLEGCSCSSWSQRKRQRLEHLGSSRWQHEQMVQQLTRAAVALSPPMVSRLAADVSGADYHDFAVSRLTRPSRAHGAPQTSRPLVREREGRRRGAEGGRATLSWRHSSLAVPQSCSAPCTASHMHHVREHRGTHAAHRCRTRAAHASTNFSRHENDSSCERAMRQAAQQLREGLRRPHVQVSGVQG